MATTTEPNGAVGNSVGVAFGSSVIENVTGFSRATLRYYERVGLIKPSRSEDSRYRAYTSNEAGRIIDCMLLKNSGYSVGEAAELINAGRADLDGLLDLCERGNLALLRWRQAIGDELARLRRVYQAGALGTPRLVRGESVLFFPNQTPEGATLPDDEIQRVLFHNAPISSTAVLFEDGALGDGPLVGRWGRSIQERLLGLYAEATLEGAGGVDLDIEAAVTLEAGPAILCSFASHIEESSALDASGAVRGAVMQLARERGVEPMGPALLTDYLPAGEILYTTLRVPVCARSALSALRLKGLPGE